MPILVPGGENGAADHPDSDNGVSLSESDSCTNDSSSSDSDSELSSCDDDSGIDDYPLPDPRWGRATNVVEFNTVSDYEKFVGLLQPLVQQQLVDHPYNTVGSFVRFYDSFKKQTRLSLSEFFRRYAPPITAEHHTCVGLSLDLLDRLKKSGLYSEFPQLRDNAFLASCEEEYNENVAEYATGSSPDVDIAFKEHVVVAFKIDICGRNGVAILDSGYHVARVITVMGDGCYPHTGWFVQTKTSKVTKQYNYQLLGNGKYVVWQVREIRDGTVKQVDPSIIYVHRKFMNCIDLVERRNLVYGFRVWVVRNESGILQAGLYFPLKLDGAFTLFYQNEVGEREECKIPFRYFQSDSYSNNNYEHAIHLCESQMQKYTSQLRELLSKISFIINDEEFLRDVLGINSIIEA